jgi:hypothetical protein
MAAQGRRRSRQADFVPPERSDTLCGSRDADATLEWLAFLFVSALPLSPHCQRRLDTGVDMSELEQLIYDWNVHGREPYHPPRPILLDDETLRDGLQSPSRASILRPGEEASSCST